VRAVTTRPSTAKVAGRPEASKVQVVRRPSGDSCQT
jgi:hypothetical protein